MTRRLGRYELLEQLGEGGMGSVWLARLTGAAGFEKLCIVKTVLPALAKEASFVSRFLHEGKVLTQLQHSNIAQVYDMGDEQGAMFIALEYVAGIDLSRLVGHLRETKQSLPVPVAIYVVQQAAEGLGAAHRKLTLDGQPLNVVHRDVSPQNIMVSYEGEVKVIDFGIARSEARSQATNVPSVMGKLGYMAPEQARGEPLDHRADQYALAVVLWELLANQPFVPRGTITEMVVAMTTPVRRPLVTLRAEVPDSLERVVLKALSVDPQQRYATTDDFARALMDELVRLSGMPSKVQIGEFVKANCAAEFQSTQALLTRVSTIRGTPGGSNAKTSVGTPIPLTTPSAAAAGAPMNTAQLEAAAIVPSKAPRVVAFIAVLTVSALAIGYALSRRSATPPPVVAKEAPPMPKVVEPTPPAPTPEPGLPAIVPPVVDAALAAPGDVVESKKTAELFTDANKTYVRAGQGDGLVVGSTLVIVGAPGTGGKRSQLGTGTVMEVFPKMSRLALDEAAAASAGARFAALGDVKVTAAPVDNGPSSVEVKKAVELFTDADKTYARAGQPDGLVVGQTVVVVSGPTAEGKRTRLGTGTVMEVFPKMSRLALDEAAAKAQGERFVAVGEVKEVVAPSNALEVKKAVEVFADGDKFYARAGKPEGLIVGQELVIVGPPRADTRRDKLGTATVMEVQGKLARVLFDPDAAKATGARFAALDVKPDAPVGTATTPVNAPAAAPSGKMTGLVKLQTEPVWAVFLTNTSKFGWNGCTLYAPGQRRMAFSSLLTGARREFAVNSFVFDPSAPNLINEVQVACKEGTFRIPAQ